MKAASVAVCALAIVVSVFCNSAHAATPARRIPADLSSVRGANYTAASAAANPNHHIDHWRNYSQATTEFDLNLARRLNLNQLRVFVPAQLFDEDKEKLRANLIQFVRACHERGIGVMPVVGYRREWTRDESTLPKAREWARFLVDTLGQEPGLAFWDVMNEPDWPTTPREMVEAECKYARYMAGVFHELDPVTPVTIGMAFVPGMEELADCVDVLSFHDYSETRGQIRANIDRAKKFAAKVGKPVFNTEIGCVARANPYDVTIQEHSSAGVGWYIWELMIVRRGWGTVHGVFFEDGTVRDPSIAAAILGFYRNRSETALPAIPDNEGRITRVITSGQEWLASEDPKWDAGLDIAERAANLLEAGELTALRELPTRRVDLMRKGQPDLPALKKLVTEYLQMLEPFQRPR